MTASEHLRAILRTINGDAHVVDASEHVDGKGVTHLVLDADGDTLGRGMSEDAAIADAIVHEHLWASKRLEDMRKGIRAYRHAHIALDALV